MTDADIVREALDNPSQFDRAPNARAALDRLLARAVQAEEKHSEVLFAAARIANKHRWSFGGMETLDALVDRYAARAEQAERERDTLREALEALLKETEPDAHRGAATIKGPARDVECVWCDARAALAAVSPPQEEEA